MGPCTPVSSSAMQIATHARCEGQLVLQVMSLAFAMLATTPRSYLCWCDQVRCNAGLRLMFCSLAMALTIPHCYCNPGQHTTVCSLAKPWVVKSCMLLSQRRCCSLFCHSVFTAWCCCVEQARGDLAAVQLSPYTRLHLSCARHAW